MSLVLLENILREKNLENPMFNALIPDEDVYTTLLYQPKDQIEATVNHFKPQNAEIINKKIEKYLDIAIEKNIDLVLLPEYSVSWVSMNNIINNSKFPSSNRLWVIGCQSIKKDELKEFIERHNSINWILDEDVYADNKTFLNPTCYIFQTKVISTHETKYVILIQFKTKPMGDIGGDLGFIERDHMIKGKTIYILRNNADSIHLSTYTCSDVLGINDAYLDGRKRTPFLFLHLQLNDSPRHQDISEYRKAYFKSKDINREVLALNWAKGTKINDSHEINFGATALYTKSSELCLTDNKINTNHEKGLYYTFWRDRRSHIYFFNNNESILIQKYPYMSLQQRVLRKKQGRI